MKQQEDRLAKLKETVTQCQDTDLYKDKKLDKIVLKTLDDISKLPFTTKEDLRSVYPYGGLAVPLSKAIEVHTSSGTSGKPVGSFLTHKDIQKSNEAISQAWQAFGIDESSRVMFAMRYGLFSGAPINTYALQSLNAFVLPAGIIPIEQYIDYILEYKIDTIVGLPGFFRYLYNKLDYMNIDVKTLSLKRVIAAGETYSETTRDEIEKYLDVKVFDHYGLAEVNTGIAYECSERNGFHILDDYVIAEVVDEKGRQVAIGESGELVLTSLEKEASPILRYRTKDVVKYLGEVECKCGRKTTMTGRIEGRKDSTISIKGVKVNIYALREQIQAEFPEALSHGVCTFKVQKNRIDYTPTIQVVSGVSEVEKFEIADFIKNKTMLSFNVETMPLSYWFEGKNKAKIVEYE